MRRALFLPFLTLTVLTPALAGAQMVAPEEARGRRACIDEARREGWDVREVSGFHSRPGRGYDVHLLVGRPGGEPTTVTCGWDGRRPTLASGYERDRDRGPVREGGLQRTYPGEDTGGGWERGASSAVDACERALVDRMREEGRRRGYDSAEAYVEQQDTGDAGREAQVIRGTGSYRFGSGPYGMMRFECRLDLRTRSVLDAHYDLEPPQAGMGPDRRDQDRGGDADDRGGGVFGEDTTRGRSRTLTCESAGGREHTCRAAIAGHVRITRRLSSASCVEGRDWWWQADAITVTNGCRAEFAFEEGVEPGRR